MLNRQFAFTLVAVFAALSPFAPSAFGASVGYDDTLSTVYTSSASWASGQNGGMGFNPWIITPDQNNGIVGRYLGTSALNGAGDGGIDLGGNSWALLAKQAGALSEAIRPFTAGGLNGLSSLAIGEQVVVRLDNGNIDNNGAVGISLMTSAGDKRFEFYFVGGQTRYTLNTGTLTQTQHGFTSAGMTLKFTLTGPDTFLFDVTYASGTPATETFSGTLSGPSGSGIDRFRFFNYQAGGAGGGGTNAFINSLQVVPEPSTAILLTFGAVAGFARRRR